VRYLSLTADESVPPTVSNAFSSLFYKSLFYKSLFHKSAHSHCFTMCLLSMSRNISEVTLRFADHWQSFGRGSQVITADACFLRLTRVNGGVKTSLDLDA